MTGVGPRRSIDRFNQESGVAVVSAKAAPFDLRAEFVAVQRSLAALHHRLQLIFEILAGIAIAISATGLIGIAVHTTQRRMHEIGVRSFPVVGLTSLFTGMVLAFQSGFSFIKVFNEPLYVGSVVGLSAMVSAKPAPEIDTPA